MKKAELLTWVGNTSGPSTEEHNSSLEPKAPMTYPELPTQVEKEREPSITSSNSANTQPKTGPVPLSLRPPPQTQPALKDERASDSATNEHNKESEQDTPEVGDTQSTSASLNDPKPSHPEHGRLVDVHHMILEYLKGSARAPVTSVYDLAKVITNTCANVFDQYTIPDTLQFFEFFERSIGNIVRLLACIL